MVKTRHSLAAWAGMNYPQSVSGDLSVSRNPKGNPVWKAIPERVTFWGRGGDYLIWRELLFNAIIKNMAKSHFLTSVPQAVLSFLGNILFFPLWWYSLGFIMFASRIIAFWRDEQKSLGFLVWLKNIFVPMYGQHDFAGRIISFFIRLIQIIFRGLILCFWIAIGLALMVVWIALPLLLIAATAFQLLPA